MVRGIKRNCVKFVAVTLESCSWLFTEIRTTTVMAIAPLGFARRRRGGMHDEARVYPISLTSWQIRGSMVMKLFNKGESHDHPISCY